MIAYYVASSVAAILIASIAIQSYLAVGFIKALRRGIRAGKENSPTRTYRPKAAVILCLRGGDPSLSDCLNALSQLDYDDWTLHLVLDSQGDPANEIVEQWLGKYGTSIHYQIHYLLNPLSSCSLKCSSLVQVVSSLSSDYEVIAQVDADTVVYRRWLCDLVAAMADPRYGASTGNRWYMPDRLSSGSLVRYCWNSAAVVQMYWYHIAWGGSIAVKLSAIEKANLISRWKNGLCEDTMLFRELRRNGLELAFAPQVMMVNREDCELPSYIRWGARQLMTVRLHHPAWAAVVGHGISTTLLVAAAIVGLIFSIATSDFPSTVIFATGLLIYQSVLVVLAAGLENAVRQVVLQQGQAVGSVSTSMKLKFLQGMWLTQIVYPLVLLRAMFAGGTEWRGIHYRFGKGGKVEMLGYRPYNNDAAKNTNSQMSL